MIKNRIRGLLKQAGTLLQQHYNNIGYTPTEELNAWRTVYNQFYCLLQLEEVVDLNYRLDEWHKQLRKDGMNKSKLEKVTKLDVIQADLELHEPALRIATILLERYRLQAFRVDVDLSIPEEEY